MPTDRTRRLLARSLAAGWWLTMILFDVAIVLIWVQVATRASWPRAIAAVVLTLIIGLPIVHEWPNAQRMRRMLVEGT